VLATQHLDGTDPQAVVRVDDVNEIASQDGRARHDEDALEAMAENLRIDEEPDRQRRVSFGLCTYGFSIRATA